MKTRHLFPLACALVLAAANATAADPRGRFLTASGNFEVDVAPCGDALCGVVSRVIANQSMSRPGETMQAVDTRPALGMKILIDFHAEGSDSPPQSWKGQIYNRENGKTYECKMSLDNKGNLVLRPYVVLPLFGQTQVWQRQEETSAPTKQEASK
jgi:uncharacterized protein (DUF2147 family)